ncbi:hypothetical protein AKJ59_00160 [candidate division MSBL1 archaeon SCGC-AAA385M02]|uniref:RecA family profile 2 domain-containing protein n=1 Tax=candidate division MSBL1 archaeon SCGC-AAA385M02 TaxID=1698287 RepID=A0A133VR69_9EURY|nr:hypothetical protein AKJ59_00160 [candidate division MSBL1 archaeon SCGC-AAA385M02]
MALLVGAETCFKSSMAALSLARAQEQGYQCIVLDSEGAWSSDFVQRWGIDPDNVIHSYVSFVEQAIDVVGSLLDEEGPFFIVLDSIGSLETKKLEEEAKAKGDVKNDMGQLQKRIKRLLKLLLSVAKSKNSTVLLTGHLYASQSMYGSPDEINGGRFVKLAPDIIISLKKSKIFDGVTKDKKVIGNQIKAITTKNRFYPAFAETVVDIDYTNGVNRYSNLEKLAGEAGIIKRSGAWYTNTKTGAKVQGNNKIGELIDEETLQELEQYVQSTGYSTINKEMEETLKEADDIVKGE